MATPMELEANICTAMDIDHLMSKLNILERTMSNSSTTSTCSDESATTTTSISPVPEFNDRSLEIRDLRLANSILSLDEDIPEHIDEDLRRLLNTTTIPNSALGHMEYLTSEHYLEYKQRLAAKKALEKKLPRSKAGRRPAQKTTPNTN